MVLGQEQAARSRFLSLSKLLQPVEAESRERWLAIARARSSICTQTSAAFRANSSRALPVASCFCAISERKSSIRQSCAVVRVAEMEEASSASAWASCGKSYPRTQRSSGSKSSGKAFIAWSGATSAGTKAALRNGWLDPIEIGIALSRRLSRRWMRRVNPPLRDQRCVVRSSDEICFLREDFGRALVIVVRQTHVRGRARPALSGRAPCSRYNVIAPRRCASACSTVPIREKQASQARGDREVG